MKHDLNRYIQLLENTPDVLSDLLKDLPDDLIRSNEGENTWSPFDIVGHLIHGEETDWMVRIRIILSDNEDRSFKPFDRFAQINDNKDKSMKELKDKFRQLRKENLRELRELDPNENDWDREGIHPDFNKVTLSELLSTWVVHDLNHISQIARVIARQYKDSVGPWNEFLPILK